ncbi:hypothetical protein LguiA_027261 [Lonicera macranthoides]
MIGKPNITNLQDTMESRSKAEWVPSRDEYLVELFIEHYNEGGITQSGFKTEVYRKVTQAINTKFNMNLDVPQIKNRYNVLKKEFGVVRALLKVSGFGWDDTKKMVVAGDKEWDDYLAVHGDAKAFRRKGFPLYDRLSILFEGQRATGKYQVSSVQVAFEEGNSNANTMQVSKSTNPSTKEVSTTQEGSSSNSDSIFQLDSGKPKKHKLEHAITSSSRKKPRLKTGDKIANAFFEMASASKIRAEQKVEANGFSKYEKCVDDLQNMEELNEEEILKSLSALRDEKNAIAFLRLKGPLRLAFLRSLW